MTQPSCSLKPPLRQVPPDSQCGLSASEAPQRRHPRRQLPAFAAVAPGVQRAVRAERREGTARGADQPRCGGAAAGGGGVALWPLQKKGIIEQ